MKTFWVILGTLTGIIGILYIRLKMLESEKRKDTELSPKPYENTDDWYETVDENGNTTGGIEVMEVDLIQEYNDILNRFLTIYAGKPIYSSADDIGTMTSLYQVFTQLPKYRLDIYFPLSMFPHREIIKEAVIEAYITSNSVYNILQNH